MAKAAFRQSDVERAIRPALSLGLSVARYEIGVDGRIVVYTAPAETAPQSIPIDDLTPMQRRRARRGED